jgi:proteasome accessory factor C
MADTAATQLNRIVQLVAELSRREREGQGPASLAEVAAHLDTKPSAVLRDIRVLTDAADDPDATWLMSLFAYQEGERISVSSRGPYRRPIRFTPEELLALRVALATEDELPAAALRALADLGDGGGVSGAGDASGRSVGGEGISAVPFLQGAQAEAVDLARAAMNAERKLEIVYAGEGVHESTARVVHVHDVIASRGRRYLVAWCERAEDWRRFRADRVIEATLTDRTFAWRDDVPTIDESQGVFAAPDDAIDDVRVKVSPKISRWVREQHPSAEPTDDGGAVITFRTASVSWLVRTVLQYGDEAEVIEPAAYREAVKRAVGV